MTELIRTLAVTPLLSINIVAIIRAARYIEAMHQQQKTNQMGFAPVKDDILKKITNVHDAWEKYLGKDIYPANPELPGCVTLAPYDE